jgi:hypothetical protein
MVCEVQELATSTLNVSLFFVHSNEYRCGEVIQGFPTVVLMGRTEMRQINLPFDKA